MKGKPRYNDTAVPKSRGKNDSNAGPLLQNLRTQVGKLKKDFVRDQNLRYKIFTDIRDILHKLMFQEVTGPLLKLSRMLHNQEGLPQLFDSDYSGNVDWPFDIRADATELYNKWYRKIFETDLMRGIKFSMSRDRDSAGDSIDPAYAGTVPANYWGNGDLLNGQWWPLMICAFRDGAHGLIQGGIYGKAGEGAYSCLMSGGDAYRKPGGDRDKDSGDGDGDNDEDYGDVVLYCGTGK